MDLRAAIVAAANFALKPVKGGVEDPRCGVVLSPPQFDPTQPIPILQGIPVPAVPGYVWATDGEMGCLIHLETGGDFPAVCLDAREAVKAVRTLGKGDWRVERVGQRLAAFHQPRGVGVLTVRAFPDFPQPPPPAPVRQWRPVDAVAMATVVHACGKDKKRPDIRLVHLRPGIVMGTDQNRISAVSLPVNALNHGMLASPALLSRRPKRAGLGAAMAVMGDWVWLQWEEELRCARWQEDKGFYKLDGLLELTGRHHTATAPLGDLQRAVVAAARSSDSGLVSLHFQPPGTVVVRGFHQKGQTAFSTQVAAHGVPQEARLHLRGRYLVEALAQLALFSGEVVLRWLGPEQPLQLSAGTLREVVWPLVVEDPAEEPKDAARG